MAEVRDLRQLADFAAGVDATALPADVLDNLAACLLYGLAVGIGTVRAKPALFAAAGMDFDQSEGGAATRLIDGKRCTRAQAAFANAVLLSGRVQGDSHPCGHMGGVVIPAAIAAAERAGATGAQLLSGLLSGYEVALRIGRDHAADLSARGFRTTPCYGVMGAAAAAGRIMGFDGARVAHAIALGANFSGGLREYVDAGTEESPFQAGFAARNGMHVADLVQAGVTAAPSALSGGAGFYRAFAEPGIDYGRRLADGLGEQFEFTTVTWKQYPACQFLRGLIRGLALLRGQAGTARAATIDIRMHPYEVDFIGVRYTGPFVSSAQTVMSAPFCAALAWNEGTASFASLRRFDDPAVLELVGRIHIHADPARARYEPQLRVTLDDGRVLDWADDSGAGNYRVTWEAASMMTRELCAEVGVPAVLADALIGQVKGIARAGRVQPLVDAVCAATRAARESP